MTYHYSGGVPVSGTWCNKFEIINGSYDIHLKFSVNGSEKEKETVSIQEGLSYSIDTEIGFGSCYGSNSSTIELSSTSASNSRTLSLDCASN